MAGLGLIERVDMHVAIALGASVHPFTSMTPNVRITVTINAGVVTSLFRKSVNVTVIDHQLS